MSLSPYERLRVLFLNSLDLEAEVYNQFESSLNTFGVEFKFYWHPNRKIDFKTFFDRLPVWKLFEASILRPSPEFIELRRRMDRPWLLENDLFNFTLTCGKLSWSVENNPPHSFFYLKDLFSKIYLSETPLPPGPRPPFAIAEFLTEIEASRSLKIKLIRTQKDTINFRKHLELVNNFRDEGYRKKLEAEFQRKINDLLQEDSLADSIVRLQLQERLGLWGQTFSDRILSAEELKKQYQNRTLQQLFPSVLDASLFLNAMTAETNDEVLDYIEQHPYKQSLLKFLQTLERQEPLVLVFAGENLEGWPEFKLRLR